MLTFTEATDENTGIYSGKDGTDVYTYTFKTTDGKTGTFLVPGETVAGSITFE